MNHRPLTPEQLAERTGAVLCGGRSRRMGRDKALIEFEGRTLLERCLDELEAVCGRVVLACGTTPRYEQFGRELALDSRADAGPLAGLLAALDAARTEWTIAVACDMPHVDREVLHELARFAAAGAWDVTMLGGDLGVEPLCAVYHRRCQPHVLAALERGESRLISFHDSAIDASAAGAATLRVTEMRTDLFPPALRTRAKLAASNLNTPADLARATSSRPDAPGGRNPR